jgi:phage gpG-like protein
MIRFENVGVFIREKVWLENSLSKSLRLFSSQNFSRINTPTFSNLIILHAHPPMKIEQSVPKRRHIKFRHGELRRRKHTTFRTGRNFEIKNSDLVRSVPHTLETAVASTFSHRHLPSKYNTNTHLHGNLISKE